MPANLKGVAQWSLAAHPSIYKNGTYTVDPDCRGSASFELEGQAGTWAEKMVIFDQGKEGITTTVSPGSVDLCRFTRMER